MKAFQVKNLIESTLKYAGCYAYTEGFTKMHRNGGGFVVDEHGWDIFVKGPGEDAAITLVFDINTDELLEIRQPGFELCEEDVVVRTKKK